MEMVVSLPTFDDLRQFVLRTLCQHDQLDPQQTPLLQVVPLPQT